MRVRVNAVAIAHLLIGLQDACHTCHQLADLTGLRVGTIRHYLKTLHAKGIIHICDWNEDARGSRTLKVYTLGSGVDMPKPKKKGAKAACAKYRAKQKQLALVTIFNHQLGATTHGQQTSA